MNPHREALLLAKGRIEAGKNYFICTSLEDVGFDCPELEDAADALRKRITAELATELGSAVSLNYWATLDARRHGIDLPETEASYYLMRLAWIDKLLEDYP